MLHLTKILQPISKGADTMPEIKQPTKFEADLACCVTQIATLATELPEMAKRGALELRLKVLNDPIKYRQMYLFMYPTLGSCLRMWWCSFVQRMTHNPEYGREGE